METFLHHHRVAAVGSRPSSRGNPNASCPHVRAARSSSSSDRRAALAAEE